MSPELRMNTQLGMAADAGKAVPKGSPVRGMRCENGKLVKACREAGHDAYGCDLVFQAVPDGSATTDRSGRWPNSSRWKHSGLINRHKPGLYAADAVVRCHLCWCVRSTS